MKHSFSCTVRGRIELFTHGLYLELLSRLFFRQIIQFLFPPNILPVLSILIIWVLWSECHHLCLAHGLKQLFLEWAEYFFYNTNISYSVQCANKAVIFFVCSPLSYVSFIVWVDEQRYRNISRRKVLFKASLHSYFHLTSKWWINLLNNSNMKKLFLPPCGLAFQLWKNFPKKYTATQRQYIFLPTCTDQHFSY